MSVKLFAYEALDAFEGKLTTFVTIEDPALARTIMDAVEKTVRETVNKQQAITGAAEMNKKMAEGGAFRKSPGRPPKQIWITHIDSTVTAPAGVNEREVYNSTWELSRLLGYSKNMCSQALSDARRFGNNEVTLRGVTFQYIDDIPGID